MKIKLIFINEPTDKIISIIIQTFTPTKVDGQCKKQLMTDRGTNLHMKLSSMRRLDMIGKPKITFLEVILELIVLRGK
jgi:hypothetical protein